MYHYVGLLLLENVPLGGGNNGKRNKKIQRSI